MDGGDANRVIRLLFGNQRDIISHVNVEVPKNKAAEFFKDCTTTTTSYCTCIKTVLQKRLVDRQIMKE